MASAEMLSYAETNRFRFLDELRRLLTFPSISSERGRKEDVHKCASWLAHHLRTIGLPHVRLIHTPGHPIVYAKTRQIVDRPNLLVYGHYDVVPAGQLDAWASPPFIPAVRGNYLLARGASDDKGQLFTHIKAIECFLKCVGQTPVNVKCVFEGEEEIGSPHLLRLLHNQPGLLDTDCVVVSDTAMLGRNRPAIVDGLRGSLHLELEIRGPRRGLHAGAFGGAIHNPWQALCEIVARLHSAPGRVAIPGFYDRVRHVDNGERSRMIVASRQFLRTLDEAGVPGAWGESRYTPYERTVLRPALIVCPTAGSFDSRSAGSVIPVRTEAQLNFRLVPNQEPTEVERLTRRYLDRISPSTVSTGLRKLVPAVRPVLMDHTHPIIQLAASACRDVFGAKPVFMRSGGTIPVVSAFHHRLRVPTVLMGFGLPDDGKHAPNERFYIPNFYRGIAASIRFMTRLGEVGVPCSRLVPVRCA